MSLPSFGDGAPDTLKFSHRAHIQDVGAACVDCHAADTTKPFLIRRATEAACKKCHDNSTASFECATCHTNSKNAKTSAPVALNIKFSRENHLTRKAACAACHGAIASSDKPGRTFIPGMKGCQTCHDGRKAPSSCATCHDNLAELKPATHDGGWLGRGGHGARARFPSADCRDCHAPNWCDACHQGNTPLRIHPAGYEFEHGFDVKSRSLDCAVCHETPRACNRCHEGKR